MESRSPLTLLSFGRLQPFLGWVTGDPTLLAHNNIHVSLHLIKPHTPQSLFHTTRIVPDEVDKVIRYLY